MQFAIVGQDDQDCAHDCVDGAEWHHAAWGFRAAHVSDYKERVEWGREWKRVILVFACFGWVWRWRNHWQSAYWLHLRPLFRPDNSLTLPESNKLGFAAKRLLRGLFRIHALVCILNAGGLGCLKRGGKRIRDLHSGLPIRLEDHTIQREGVPQWLPHFFHFDV